MIRIGVIGYGYWGPNLVRNFVESPDTRVVMVSDLKQDRLDLVQRRYPGVEVTTDFQEILNHPNIDAVAISTPVSTHFPLALQALQSGKHVLVEKPMTTTSEDALRLIDEAERRKLILMVDHTFVYTGAVRKIRELIDKGSLGDIYYYDSTRVNLGLFQSDVDVIWDLAVHDLSIMDYILPSSPVAVSATGVGHVTGATENIAYVTVFYDNSLIAHLNVNWLSPVKIRRTLIGGSKQMIVYDDIESSEKIKVYDKGVTVKNGSDESRYKLLVSYRSGDIYSPQIDVTEALRIEAQHFADCIKTGKAPITDGHAGLRVVSVLEAATKSMKQQGRAVQLKAQNLAVA
ncbi:MAG: Gfo/Idh/MocA family oxidoreductase [Bryobacterales bacterium]|nr:Gfo/Idh/MocA family oxidoreductase [Bryobacterales bacterium]